MAASDAGHSAVVEKWFGELVKTLLVVPTAPALHRWAVVVLSRPPPHYRTCGVHVRLRSIRIRRFQTTHAPEAHLRLRRVKCDPKVSNRY